MNSVVLAGRTQKTVSAGSQSDPLEVGTYDVWAATDTYIKVGEIANDVTSSTGYLIKAGNVVPVKITQTGHRIGSTAALSYHEVM